MKLKKIINDKEFQDARLTIYSILFISYIYLAYFSNFKCNGCPLCRNDQSIKMFTKIRF